MGAGWGRMKRGWEARRAQCVPLPRQTAVKRRLLRPVWCLTKAGYPAGEATDPGTDSLAPKMEAFGIQASEQARGAPRGPVMTKQL